MNKPIKINHQIHELEKEIDQIELDGFGEYHMVKASQARRIINVFGGKMHVDSKDDPYLVFFYIMLLFFVNVLKAVRSENSGS